MRKVNEGACFITSDEVGNTMTGEKECLDEEQEMRTGSDKENLQNLSLVGLMLQTASDDDRVFMSGEEILIFSPTSSENFLLDSQLETVVPESGCYYARADSEKLQKFLLKECNTTPSALRKCISHRSKFEACNILNMSNHPAKSGLAADIKSAYHTILVDLQSTYLRLFFWWSDLPECTKAKIYRQLSQSFGDPGASCGLEIAILKFIVENAELDVTKFICEFAVTPITSPTQLRRKPNISQSRRI